MRVPLYSGIGILFLFGTLPAPAQTAQEKEFQHGYRFFQNSAPEFLQIEVLEVTAEASKGLFGGSMTQVKARARVIDVIRSDSGTPNGQVIEIRYEHAPKAGNSAETPPILEKEKSYPAFLKRTGNIYVPVARHLSFSPPSGVQMKVYEVARTRSREKALLAANTPSAPPINIPVVEPAPLPPSAIAKTKSAPAAEPVEPAPAPPAPSAPKATPVVEPAPPAPSAPKAAPVVEPAPPAPSARKATPVVEPAPPAPSAAKAAPVAEPLPPAPQSVVAEAPAVEAKTTEPTPPAPEPSQMLRDARKARKSKAAAAAAAKANAELTPAAAESGPLPTHNPPASTEPATAAATPKEDKPATPATAPAKPTSVPPAATAKNNKAATPPPAPAPQVSRAPAPKPKEEPLPNIPIEAPVTPPAETAQKPAPQPSTEGAEARKGYAEIYGLIKEGETVQNEGKNDKAREIYTQAREKLLILKSEQPEFQPFMVQYRIRDLEKKLETLSAPAPAKPPGSPAK